MEFHTLLKNLNTKSFFSDLIIERGIEKESLRIDRNGFISKSDHPKSLGSSYTNSSITTDFAESLIEIVTPTYTNIDELYGKLKAIHVFINQNLNDAQGMRKCCSVLRGSLITGEAACARVESAQNRRA